MIELECLVIVRATAKSKVVLACAEFEIEIIIDDKPRVPLLRKCGLDQFEDPRFLRLVMKLQSLQLQSRKGHSLAITHSRAPIDSPTENDLRMVGIKTGMLAKVKRKLISIAFLVNFANYFDRTWVWAKQSTSLFSINFIWTGQTSGTLVQVEYH